MASHFGRATRIARRASLSFMFAFILPVGLSWLLLEEKKKKEPCFSKKNPFAKSSQYERKKEKKRGRAPPSSRCESSGLA